MKITNIQSKVHWEDTKWRQTIEWDADGSSNSITMINDSQNGADNILLELIKLQASSPTQIRPRYNTK